MEVTCLYSASSIQHFSDLVTNKGWLAMYQEPNNGLLQKRIL